MSPYCSCGVIQVSTSPDISIRNHLQCLLSLKADIFLQGAFTDTQTHHRVAKSASLATSTTRALWRHVVFFLLFYYI